MKTDLLKQDRSMGEVTWHTVGRQWEIRHQRDQGVEKNKLRNLGGLEHLEEMVRRDAEGNYRPLRSERNLISGWFFRADGEDEFREAMEVIYPGLWGNAEAWRQGKLHMEPWEVVLARQTERTQRAAWETGDLPQKVVEGHCNKRCLKNPLWAGERLRKETGGVPMICTGPCGMFWSCLEG